MDSITFYRVDPLECVVDHRYIVKVKEVGEYHSAWFEIDEEQGEDDLRYFVFSETVNGAYQAYEDEIEAVYEFPVKGEN